MPIDLTPLWDFAQPAVSEQRFQAALPGAAPDDALVLLTQIARSHGLRRDFARARAVLADVAARLPGAATEPQARYHLELGRTWVSATHPPEQLTDDARRQAGAAYQQALALARAGGLDGLAVDALHMLAFVPTDLAGQLAWNQQALALAQQSSQPEARRWLGSLHHNIGYNLHQMGRLDEALAQFELALAQRQQAGRAQAIREAHWMIAWTLRGLGRLPEALAIQQRLEVENDQAGQPDPYVYEELALLYRAMGDAQRADHYDRRHAATR